MSALTFSTAAELGDARSTLEKLRATCGPLASVIAIHALLFYFVYSGMLHRMVDVALQPAVMVNFVELPVPKEPPAAPKLVPLVQLPPPVVPVVPVPVVQIAVVPQNTITVEQSAAPVAPRAPVQVAAAPAPAAPVAGPATPKTITSGIEYIHPPQTVYPMMSKRMGEQGKVVLRILVNEKGLPDQVQVQTSSGFARLDEAGRQAGMRALFKPRLEDGRAVAVYVIVPVNFTLAT